MLSYRCWAEVDLEALRTNLAWIRHRVGPRVRIMTVVKADAYGHGLKPIAALLMQSGTDVFGVASLAEAHAVRSVGRGWPVLMLGAALPDEVETVVREQVMPTLSSRAEAEAFSAAAAKARRTVPVHVKIDTGMGRLGVAPDRALDLIQAVRGLPGLRMEGVFTHFASAEEDRDFCREQLRRFREVLANLGEAGIAVPVVHASNSAALLHEPEATFDLVRPGLLVYGILPPGGRRAGEVPVRDQVRAALSWKCRVGLVKEIPKGTSLSYGSTFVAPRRMRVATLTAGYGDGYARAGSNRARVLVGGRRCRVLGRITMDQMIVDVSRTTAHWGDEAVLVGRQGDDEVTATEVAGWCDTVPWEVVTGITQRVARVYKGGHAA